jgi:hypothetical protein
VMSPLYINENKNPTVDKRFFKKCIERRSCDEIGAKGKMRNRYKKIFC